MQSFVINDKLWTVVYVPYNSSYLIDRTGAYTIATTDPSTYCIYISDEVTCENLYRVLIHEIAHATIISFALDNDIYRMARPGHQIELEEWICEFIAEYGILIYESSFKVTNNESLALARTIRSIGDIWEPTPLFL